MKFKELKNQIKQSQKKLAKEIRRGKHLRKPKNRINLSEKDIKLYFWGQNNYSNGIVDSLSTEYRYIHVAYCTFFNKTPVEKIEVDPSRLDESFYKSYHEIWAELIDETICNSAS